MTCYLCWQPITRKQQIEHHHPIYKNKGGIETAPTHKACHRNFHSAQGDFKAWGRIGGSLTAMTRVWAFNLKHVRHHAAFELDRQFYRAFYAK